jgi:hypothetical protein
MLWFGSDETVGRMKIGVIDCGKLGGVLAERWRRARCPGKDG